MKYYCISDIHGHYTLLMEALRRAGYFDDEHARLVLLGDLFDRGKEAAAMQEFVLQQMEQERVILIRGNHESLFQSFATQDDALPLRHHLHNGTFRTALELTGFPEAQALQHNREFAQAVRQTPYFTTILPAMRDYYETPHYLFVHGWIPTQQCFGHYLPVDNWRQACPAMWERARWINGMDAVKTVREPGKTILCGHIPASYGHARDEPDNPTIHTPYSAPGILAIDGSTFLSGTVNCVVIED